MYRVFTLSWSSAIFTSSGFQECYTHARQNAMVMCQYVKIAIQNVQHHMNVYVHLNISAVTEPT